MQTRSSSKNNRKRIESPDHLSRSNSTDSPGYSPTETVLTSPSFTYKSSEAYSSTSPPWSPDRSYPEPSVAATKSVSKNSHQRYNPPVKKADPNRIARATALFGSLPIDPITGNPIPHKGRARSLGNRKIDTSFPPIKKRRGAVSKTVRPYSSKERKHKR